jgi:hypothetical protein
MHILLEIDLSLYLLLFVVAGLSGFLVKIDQWVEGDYNHPTRSTGRLHISKSFWSYVLTFVLSGIAGTMVAIGGSYFMTSHDTNIMLFSAITVGAIGRLIFYKLVEWVHDKFDNNVTGSHRLRSTSGRDVHQTSRRRDNR